MNSLIIKVDGVDYIYECHTYATGADIIAGVYKIAIENNATIEGWEFV